jgi:hypothetical protein
VTLTPDERRAVGDAWGRLAGVVVDACKSHHECHCGDPAAHVLKREQTREATELKVSPHKCVRSTGKTTFETVVAVSSGGTDLYLAVSAMNLLSAGKPMATNAIGASPEPDHITPLTNSERVTVKVEAITPPGLYVGRLGPNTGGDPQIPILLFVDGMD